MSSEELRLDLESFINKGLDRGLHGWPAKGRERPVEGNGSHRLRSSTVFGLARRLRERVGMRALEAVRGA